MMSENPRTFRAAPGDFVQMLLLTVVVAWLVEMLFDLVVPRSTRSSSMSWVLPVFGYVWFRTLRKPFKVSEHGLVVADKLIPWNAITRASRQALPFRSARLTGAGGIDILVPGSVVTHPDFVARLRALASADHPLRVLVEGLGRHGLSNREHA